MNVGDLVKHKWLGGVGIIIELTDIFKNGGASFLKVHVKWATPPTGQDPSGYYSTGMLEEIKKDDKKT